MSTLMLFDISPSMLQLLTVVFTFASTIGVALIGYCQLRLRAEQARQGVLVAEVAVNTNSMKDALVAATKKSATMEGMAIGRAEEKAHQREKDLR